MVAPERRGELAAIADEVFDDRYAGLQGWLRPDYPFMSRLLGGGRSPVARRVVVVPALRRGPRRRASSSSAAATPTAGSTATRPFWCSDAAHDFDIDATAVASLREREALDEWRDLRRRP